MRVIEECSGGQRLDVVLQSPGLLWNVMVNPSRSPTNRWADGSVCRYPPRPPVMTPAGRAKTFVATLCEASSKTG